jgi:hypothetical protein
MRVSVRLTDDDDAAGHGRPRRMQAAEQGALGLAEEEGLQLVVSH